MSGGRSVQVALILIAIVVTCAGLSAASTVFAPLAFALLIIAILWPLQNGLQSVMPKLVALLISIVVLVVSFAAFGSLIVWAFGRVGRSIADDAARFQAVYDELTSWFESHGIAVTTLWAEHVNIGWFVRLAQSITARLNSTISFWLIVMVYVVLGLLEVDNFANSIRTMQNRQVSGVLLKGSIVTAAKIRAYMLVRTQMSVITGVLVFAVAYAVGLPLAKEWGIIAFVLNYIPFLGPLIATLFPTAFAIAEFQSWESAALIFVALNVIQIVIGSYVEPRVSGNALSISPPLILFAVFFWTYLWGIFGAFIGVPIAIAILTYCDQDASTRWVAHLFGGGGRDRDAYMTHT